MMVFLSNSKKKCGFRKNTSSLIDIRVPTIADPEKRKQEIASLVRIPDSFGKIVVVRDYIKPWKDENGILYLGVEQFLLGEEAVF